MILSHMNLNSKLRLKTIGSEPIYKEKPRAYKFIWPTVHTIVSRNIHYFSEHAFR